MARRSTNSHAEKVKRLPFFVRLRREPLFSSADERELKETADRIVGPTGWYAIAGHRGEACARLYRFATLGEAEDMQRWIDSSGIEHRPPTKAWAGPQLKVGGGVSDQADLSECPQPRIMAPLLKLKQACIMSGMFGSIEPPSAVLLTRGGDMVGIQCKSCGHRALRPSDPAKFQFDNEVMELLRRSPPTCSSCGGSEIHLLSITGGLADKWLSDGRPLPASGPLIEGGKPGE